MDARTLSAGDVAGLPLPDGSWAACLVTAADDDGVSVCALDWQSPHPPTVAELAGTPPLRLDHHLFTARWAHHTVQATEAVPPSLDWIGRLPVPGAVRDSPNSYASWTVLTYDVLGQRRWDKLDPTVRAAYRAVTSGPGVVELTFGAETVTLDPRRTNQLDLSDGSVPLPATGDPSWSALDRLGRCTALTWRGADRGLTAALAARPLVTRLTWIDPPAEVDLSGTALTDLTLRGSMPVELRLPPGCHGLALEPQPPGRGPRAMTAPGQGLCAVSADAGGRWLALRVTVTDAEPVPLIPDGVAAVREVRVLAAGSASIASLVALAELEQLMVLSGAKTDLWLAANLDNPLRDWVDDDTRGGAAACKAYADALRAITKLPPAGPERRDQAIGALHTMITRLNAIDARLEMIDTVRREEACAAFADLAGQAGIPAAEADDLCDTWRDW